MEEAYRSESAPDESDPDEYVADSPAAASRPAKDSTSSKKRKGAPGTRSGNLKVKLLRGSNAISSSKSASAPLKEGEDEDLMSYAFEDNDFTNVRRFRSHAGRKLI